MGCDREHNVFRAVPALDCWTSQGPFITKGHHRKGTQNTCHGEYGMHGEADSRNRETKIEGRKEVTDKERKKGQRRHPTPIALGGSQNRNEPTVLRPSS